jgi:hypothetical protein
MKRVYLDQMKWIDLARADTLLVARRGVDNGLVSFPLSSIHYIETAKRRDERSRRALARTMATLSRFHTIASPRALVPPEIDLALHRRFGRPTNPRAPEAFGVGVAHALNIEADPCALPEGLPIDPQLARNLEAQMASLYEWYALAGLPPGLEVDQGFYDRWQTDVATDLAAQQEALRVVRTRDGWHVGERSRRVATAAAFLGWQDEMSEALARAELGWDDVFSLDYGGMTALLETMPTIHVASELQRQREAAANSPWSSHDVADVFFLMGAVVYCDIVVTERQWVDLIRRSGLDDLHGTVMLSDLGELPQYIA